MSDQKPKFEKAKPNIDVSTLSKARAYFFQRILKGLKNKVKGLWARELTARALSFSRVNRESLVIIGDTRKDTLILAYNEKFMTIDIRSKFLHINQRVIRKCLLKQYDGLNDQQKRETAEEFTHILRSAVYQFIEHVNEPIKQKVAENINQ